MMHYYETYGPFEIPRKRGAAGRLHSDLESASLKQFWADVESTEKDLSRARGCYVFATRAGRGIKPWYVGQSKTGFRNECFQPQKKVIYQEVCNEVVRGKPILVLVARLTRTGRFMRGRLKDDEATFLERILMLQALSNNSALKNTAGLASARRLQVPGLLNSPLGAPSAGARLLRQVL